MPPMVATSVDFLLQRGSVREEGTRKERERRSEEGKREQATQPHTLYIVHFQSSCRTKRLTTFLDTSTHTHIPTPPHKHTQIHSTNVDADKSPKFTKSKLLLKTSKL